MVERVVIQVQESGSEEAARRVRNVGVQSNFAGQAVNFLVTALGIYSSAQVIGQAIQRTREFGLALAEVRTIAGDAHAPTAELREEVTRLSVEFGVEKAEITRAYYQAISSGAQDAADANVLLRQSLALATGGLTTPTQALDLLVSVARAYNLEFSEVARISDEAFASVEVGRFRIEALLPAIGRLLPAANTLGVEFSELSAAFATLTTSGFSAPLAGTALLGVLNAVINPAEAARERVQELGIDLRQLLENDITEFVRVLRELDDSTITTLFPDIRGLGGILALRNQLETLDENLMRIEDSAGATERAVGEIEDTFDFRWRTATMALNAELDANVQIIQERMIPVLELLTDNMDDLVRITGIFFGLWGAARTTALLANLNAVRLAMIGTGLLTVAGTLGPIGALIAASYGLNAALTVTRDETAANLGTVGLTLPEDRTFTDDQFRAFNRLADELEAARDPGRSIAGPFANRTAGTIGRSESEIIADFVALVAQGEVAPTATGRAQGIPEVTIDEGTTISPGNELTLLERFGDTTPRGGVDFFRAASAQSDQIQQLGVFQQVSAITAALRMLREQAEDTDTVLQQGILEASNDFRNVFREGFSEIISGSGNVGDAVENMFNRIRDRALNFAADNIFSAVFGDGSGGSNIIPGSITGGGANQAGGLFRLITNAIVGGISFGGPQPGNASGTGFISPGARRLQGFQFGGSGVIDESFPQIPGGGIDDRLILGAGHLGERYSFTPRGQRGGGGGMVFNNSFVFNGNVNNPDEVSQSMNQYARRLQRQLATAQQRFG